jgi:selenocysteine lyase/cysteine desulfurase
VDQVGHSRPAAFRPEDLNSEFPVKQERTYLNTASEGLLPLRSLEAMFSYLRARRTELTVPSSHDDEVEQQLREKLGRLLGAREEDMGLSFNTSVPLNICALALPWKSDSNIVLPQGEFPANVYPWLNLARRGVEVRLFERGTGRLRVEEFTQHMDRRTVAVAVSVVDFRNGNRVDLAALSQLCHERDCLLVVDGIQGVGVIPLLMEDYGVDLLAGGGAKWLLAPTGTGFLYCSGRITDRIGQPLVGWNRMTNRDPMYYRLLDYRNEPVQNASRFEIGTLPTAGYAAMNASVDLILELGVDTIWAHVRRLRERLIQGLQKLGVRLASEVDPEFGSGIVSFYAPDPRALVARLAQERIHVSAREGVLRTSLHLYNTEEDVDTLLLWLDRLQDMLSEEDRKP